MQTKQTVPGQRSEIRLREEIKGTVIGAVTARIQEVAPFDCAWVTKVSVEVFADVALKYKSPSAKKVNQLFAKAISNRICCGKKELMKVLSQAISLEEDILKHLPRDVNPDTRKRFSSGIEELKRSIKADKVKASIRAQGLIAEAARGLLVR